MARAQRIRLVRSGCGTRTLADPSLALYGGDGFHPTAAGSYAAALTIFAGLSGRSPLGLPAPATVDPTKAQRLQEAAQNALERYGDYGPTDVP